VRGQLRAAEAEAARLRSALHFSNQLMSAAMTARLQAEKRLREAMTLLEQSSVVAGEGSSAVEAGETDV
jgi:hypothetical protein